MPEFTWSVFLPGEDLPQSLSTDYLLSDGEQITIGGSRWLVESVTINDANGIDEDASPGTTGSVTVVPDGAPPA
jgi:hypothetical protein